MSRLSCMMSIPRLSRLDWWLLMMRPRPLRAQKDFVTFQPKVDTAPPRGEACTPKTSLLSVSSSIGSDHSRLWTHASVLSSFSGRRIPRMSSTLKFPSPMPPCTHRMRSEIRQATGMTSKARWKSSNSLGPNDPSLWLHSSRKPYLSFMKRNSWLPRTSHTFSGSSTLNASSRPMTSSWCSPRSTKSPLKTNIGASRSSGLPKARNMSNRSLNWPWMSPKILQGARASTSDGWTAQIFEADRAKRASVSTYSWLKSSTRKPFLPQPESNASRVSLFTSFASCHACFTTALALPLALPSTRPPDVRAPVSLVLYLSLAAAVAKSSSRVCISLPVSSPQRATASTFRLLVKRGRFFQASPRLLEDAAPVDEASASPAVHDGSLHRLQKARLGDGESTSNLTLHGLGDSWDEASESSESLRDSLFMSASASAPNLVGSVGLARWWNTESSILLVWSRLSSKV
mmetsp:Transcript_78859/g.211750  ORF Transcript_78859/g.211750 Transcript_78859/m.211750 type:complete len:459 (-) Transcript_78859:284-1660(-)